MFDKSQSREPHPSVVLLRDWLRELGELDREVSDADRVDQLRALEELKNAACAAQARVSVDLDASQRSVQAAAGVPAKDQGRGVAAQIGLARRESANKGARYLGLAKVLVAEMPHTYAAMRAGWLSEWRATLVARETGCLSVEDRAAVDRALLGDRAGEVRGWGDKQLIAAAGRLAYQLDRDAVLARIRRAVGDRCVTSRPAPDTMAYLTALLPAAQAVGCYAALLQAAAGARAGGDERSRGQVMADTLVQRVTGQPTAEATPVEIQVVVTDQTLLANLGNPPEPAVDIDHEPAIADDPADGADPATDPGWGDPRDEPGYLQGYGIVPAAWIRDLIGSLPVETQAWLRRVYAHPGTGDLVAMDARRREFRAGLRRQLVTRDRICRTPFCGAPIRHADHPIPYARGGPTSQTNSQGLCEACNYAKEAPGWSARTVPGVRHTVRTTTPTGHVYDSTAPPLPGHYPKVACSQVASEADPSDTPEVAAPPVDPLSPSDLDVLWAHLAENYAA